jgi:3'(2'), 5'-bisphosphate nucleotidase
MGRGAVSFGTSSCAGSCTKGEVELVVSDVEVAGRAAQAAADALLQLRRDAAGQPDLRDRGDRAGQSAIMEVLTEQRPDDAVLSEEAVDDPSRLRSDRVWIVDPLDGTREYGEGDRHDWAVHVALWESGELTAAAVALPARGCVLTTDDPTGGVVVAAAYVPDRPRFAVSRTRATAEVTDLARALGGDLVPLGSAGYKASAVVLGEVDAYVHSGGQYEWDSAAPVAVARAAGLHTSRLDGSPLTYNRADPSLPDLVICRPELTDAILDRMAATVGRPQREVR